MSAYLITRDGQQLGSFEVSQIREGLQTGYFQATDWGWREGMTAWQPLPDLASAGTQPLVATQPAVNKPVAVVPKSRTIATPSSIAPSSIATSSIARTQPAGATLPSINPYAAPAKTLGGAGGVVPYPVIAELAGTKPWVRLISVLMWIASVLVILAILVNGVISVFGASSLVKSGKGGAGVGVLLGMAVFYGVTALLIIYPTLKLSNYASHISRLAQTQSFADLTAALAAQRRFWKYYGILTVIYLSVMLLFVIFVVIAGIGIFSMSVPKP